MTPRNTLTELEQTDEFIGRHIGINDADAAAMLGVIGAASLEALIDQTVPKSFACRRIFRYRHRDVSTRP